MQNAADLCVLYVKTPKMETRSAICVRRIPLFAKYSRIVCFVRKNTQNGESECNLCRIDFLYA